jgi:hypothetical protein
LTCFIFCLLTRLFVIAEFEFPIKFDIASCGKVLFGTTSKKVILLQDELNYLKDAYKRKLEDVTLESIVTQEELAAQFDIGRQKDELIVSQSLEITTLRNGLELLKSKWKSVEKSKYKCTSISW